MFLYPCKDRDKDKVGDRPAKLNEKESGRELAREKKANDKIFLLEEKHENFVVAVRKWEVLAATKVKMIERQWKKNVEQEHVRHFLHKTCN